MNKRKSLEKILEHYEMDVHWADCAHFDSEDEMINTLIRAKEYVRELEETKEKEKKGVK